MKILTADQQRLLDSYTIVHEPISSIDLMERASKACYEKIVSQYNDNYEFVVFCGVGNNGGDGLAISRLLFLSGFKVKVFIVSFSDKCSPDFIVNKSRLLDIGLNFTEINDASDLEFNFFSNTILIDAIFGTGLSRPIMGISAQVIKKINLLQLKVISIDIPSGLFCEDNSENNPENIINACQTFTFQAPKLSFLFPENDPFVGHWEVLDIGLDINFINSLPSNYFYISPGFIKSIYKKRNKFSHKGTFGHALVIAGSKGKIGAAHLAANACLRAGAGLLTIHIPGHAVNILQTSLPEAMLSIDNEVDMFSECPKLELYSSIGVGPGLGTEKISANALKQLIQTTKIPLVIDADALNILSENKTWLSFLTPNSVLTPHPKEFERLFGKTDNSYERLKLAKEMAFRFQVYIVLKGAHTLVVSPNGNCFFNSTGNPGMAKAGSGDVLSGIITSLIAQGYSSLQASVFGVFIHGLSGDIAAATNSMEAMMASDIIANLGRAFLVVNDY